jgi:hypothetical protein
VAASLSIAATLARDTTPKRYTGLSITKAANPRSEMIRNVVDPSRDRAHERTGDMERRMGVRVVSNASSCPAIPSSHTEK